MRMPLVFAACLLASACTQTSGSQPAPATSSQTPALAAPAGSSFGAPITSKQVVHLADLARDPAHFSGQTIVLTGTVTDVCQHMGCWMVIEDAGQKARVRMHDHAFFVPRDCKGKKARVQGQASLPAAPAPAHTCQHQDQPGDHHDCPKDQPGEIAFDATGVELL